MPCTEGERIRALEIRVDNLVASVDHLTSQVETLNELLHAAKGIRWLLSGFLVILGFIVGKMEWLVNAWSVHEK